MTTEPLTNIVSEHKPWRILPTITLTEDDKKFVKLHADGRNGTGYLDEDASHNTIYGDGSSRFQHLNGIMGEAAVAKYFDGSVREIDDRLTRSGDDGVDLRFKRDVEYDDDDITDGIILADVKSTRYGYSNQVLGSRSVPLLKIKRHKHTAAPNRIYILCEIINHESVRIIGYIHSDYISTVGEKIDRGDVYKPHIPRKKFKSQANNWVVDPESTDKFKSIWRDW